MKKSYLGTLLFFVLAIIAIALLSSPRETTWIAMYLDNQKLKRAEELLWKHYRRDPGDLETAGKLADTLQALGKQKDSKELVQEVLSRVPDNIQWKRRLAFILLSENDPLAAAKVLPEHERNREFWLAFAQACHDMGLDELAEKAIFSAYKDNGDKSAVWRVLAAWRAGRNDSMGEKEALEQALNYAPEDGELIGRYFRNRARAGDLAAVLRAADKLPKPLDREYLEALYELYRADNNYQEAQEILEQLIARKDATPADSLALVSILYSRNDLARAKTLLEKLALQEHSFSPAVKEALRSQTQAVRSALLLQAAQEGREQEILDEIEELRAGGSVAITPDALRNLVYACLRLSDFYGAASVSKTGKSRVADERENGATRSQFWLEQAKSLFNRNRAMLPLAERDNAYLAADLAERSGEWRAMQDAWTVIARKNDQDIHALLGMARAAQQLGEHTTALRALSRAEALATEERDIAALALQFQTLARALPPTHPQRGEKLRHADDLARKSLAKNWNDALGHNLFFRALETGNLGEADALLRSLENRGLATQRAYLGLAEAQVASELRRQGNGKGTVISAKTVPAGAGRERASRNALKAMDSAPAETLPRLLYVFMALNDKKRVSAILERMEHAHMADSPRSLRQMAEAYAFLEDQERQSSLLEKRALLTGREADWIEAIDLLFWRGNYQAALRLLDAAEARHPGNPELKARRILNLVDMGRYGQAIEAFQNARRQNPEIGQKMSADSVAALGVAYDKRGKPEHARRFFKLSLKKDPANGRAMFALADLSQREGKTAEAERLLQKTVELNPEHLWARAQLANLRPDQAKRHYESILTNAPDDAGVGEKSALALALRKTGRLRKALQLYSELVKNAQRTPSLLCDYAQALVDADRLGEAKSILHGAIREFPDHLAARRLLASIFIQEKDYAGAEGCLRKALALAPGNSEISRELAFVQQVQEKSWAAQKRWRNAGKR